MKKCISCGKEFGDNVKGCCPECGEELIKQEPEKSSVKKSVNKKKLTAIIAAAALLVCAVVAVTFIALNSSDNQTPVSQTSKDKKDKKSVSDNKKSGNEDKTPAKGQSSDTNNTKSVNNTDSGNVENTVGATSTPGTDAETPEGDIQAPAPDSEGTPEGTLTADNLEALINEFNDPNTPPERREELRILLENFFNMFAGETITLE